MLCETFSESWFNGDHWVARRKLRPLCLWHWTYLHFIDSPLAPGAVKVKDAPPIGWADIILASRVCQLEYHQQLPPYTSLAERLKAKAELFYLMARTTEEKELSAYYNYVSDYFAPPMFNSWKDDNKKKLGRPPDPLSIASACIMLFGGGVQVEKIVWEMPIGKAYWYASTLHYNRGATLDYVTAKDEAIRRFLRSQKEKGLI